MGRHWPYTLSAILSARPTSWCNQAMQRDSIGNRVLGSLSLRRSTVPSPDIVKKRGMRIQMTGGMTGDSPDQNINPIRHDATLLGYFVGSACKLKLPKVGWSRSPRTMPSFLHPNDHNEQ